MIALVGFTRLDAVTLTPNIHGEYETDVERAQIAIEPSWFPAVQSRGEGIDLGLHVRDPSLATSASRHFQVLIDRRLVAPLPAS